MSEIGLIGYGALGVQIEHMIRTVHPSTSVIRFDDMLHATSPDEAYPFDAWRQSEFRQIPMLVALGYKHLPLKSDILSEIDRLGGEHATFIHPTVYVDPTARTEPGCVIYPGVIVDAGVNIGRGCLLNLGAIIAHDTQIGAACFISPGVTLSGHVHVGPKTFIGAGSVVTNTIKIGENCVIGAGSLVSRSLDAGQNAIGNPLRIVQKLALL